MLNRTSQSWPDGVAIELDEETMKTSVQEDLLTALEHCYTVLKFVDLRTPVDPKTLNEAKAAIKRGRANRSTEWLNIPVRQYPRGI
jgi:hypothetical protein